MLEDGVAVSFVCGDSNWKSRTTKEDIQLARHPAHNIIDTIG